MRKRRLKVAKDFLGWKLVPLAECDFLAFPLHPKMPPSAFPGGQTTPETVIGELADSHGRVELAFPLSICEYSPVDPVQSIEKFS